MKRSVPSGGQTSDAVLTAAELSHSETGAEAIRPIHFVRLIEYLRIFDLRREHNPSVRHVQKHFPLCTRRERVGRLNAFSRMLATNPRSKHLHSRFLGRDKAAFVVRLDTRTALSRAGPP